MALSFRFLTVILLGSALATGALAQTRPDANADTKPPMEVPGRVLSDAQPLPAEDRDSTGALKLHGSPVRAEKDAAGGKRNESPRVGREAERVLGGARGSIAPSDSRAGQAGSLPGGTPE